MNKMEKIAEELLSIGAVFLRPKEPFIWASGIKSPIYCDNRIILSFPGTRTIIENALAECIKQNFPECRIIMGTSTAGIAHAALAAHILDLPAGYVRSSAKTHGRTARIEGKTEAGQKAVIVEDLISTGGSAVDTAGALREVGIKVLGIVSIFTYGMKKAEEKLKENDLVNISLCDLDSLVKTAKERGYISAKEAMEIIRFRDCPSDQGLTKGAKDE
jgi:orotate phosphoribosyltransferase